MGKRWFNRALMLMLIGCAAAPVLAQDCRLDEAQRAFESMRMDQTILLLEDCRSQDWPGIDTNQKTAALRLLALAYIEQGAVDLARESVRLLMREDRRYRADPNLDPLVFQVWVRDLKPKAWYQKKWFHISVAAVVGGVLGVVLSTDKVPDLPPPMIGPPSK